MKIYLKKSFIEVPVKKLSLFGRFRGLMFRRRKNSEILLFNFEKPTKTIFHSLFCFFPFLIIWLDKENNVLESRICKPFLLTIKSFYQFVKVIEIPINKKYKKLINEILDARKV